MKRTPSYKTCTECGSKFLTASSIKTMCSPECRVRATAKQFQGIADCWNWPKSLNPQTGYGQLSAWIDGKRILLTAHRVSYSAFRGQIEDGKYVCHSCDNRQCFNPAHLFLGDQSDNMRDMVAKGRYHFVKPEIAWQHRMPERVPRGESHHLKKDSSCLPRGSAHPGAKLKESDVLEIRASSERGARLAERYGVSQCIISAVKKRKIWKHLP